MIALYISLYHRNGDDLNMLRRVIALSLFVIIILLCLTSFDLASVRIPSLFEVAYDVEEYFQERVSVLIIGNNHAVDAFWLLYQAYMDQHPDVNLCVGILHYGGANIDEYVAFGNNGEEKIRYYKNDSGKWNIQYDVTTEYVLTDHPWDIIMMQPAVEDFLEPTLSKYGRYALAEIMDRCVKNPHEIMWYVSWPSPNDETFFSEDYVRQPPKGYKDQLTRLYDFDPVKQFSAMVNMTKNHILEEPIYSKAICSGTSIMHAHLVQGVPQLELWRDYTHLSDYGRLMVAYALVAQITNEPIRDVGIDEISAGWRHKQNEDQGKLRITQEMKDILISAANYALESPWVIPEALNK